MILKINGVELAEYPSSFSVKTIDIDDGESTVRTADGTLNRDRIAVKRQIDISWGLVEWSKVSAILTAMKPIFFDFYYPDPETGQYETKTFYVGDRPVPAAVSKDGKIYWNGLKATLTER